MHLPLVPLQEVFRHPNLAHDPRIVRLSQQGNSIRVVARSHEDVGSWVRDLAQHGLHAGAPVDIDVPAELDKGASVSADDAREEAEDALGKQGNAA